MSNKFDGVGVSVKLQIQAIRSLIETSCSLHKLLSGGTLNAAVANNITNIVTNIDNKLDILATDIDTLVKHYDDIK